ncbi:MAG: hypothetical protein ABJC10_11920 [Acidobacteriota bacterium]
MKTTRTKKTTVITTEKREVWVIRQRSGMTQEQAEESLKPDSSGESAIVVLNELPTDNDPPERRGE